MIDNLFGKRLPGQLPKPLPLLDLVYGQKYVAYQGQRPGKDPYLITAYFKKAGDTRIYEENDIPKDGLFQRHAPNGGGLPEGVWVWLEGHKGVPTLAQDIIGITPGIMNKIAEQRMLMDSMAANLNIAQKKVFQTQEEHAHELAKNTKEVRDAGSPSGMNFRPQISKNIT